MMISSDMMEDGWNESFLAENAYFLVPVSRMGDRRLGVVALYNWQMTLITLVLSIITLNCRNIGKSVGSSAYHQGVMTAPDTTIIGSHWRISPLMEGSELYPENRLCRFLVA
jgi:hypothetical protein